MYRPLFYTALCLLFSHNIAQAASNTKQPPQPSEDLWTGFYGGFNAGYAWSYSTATFSTPASYVSNPSSYWSLPEVNQLNGLGVFKIPANGSTGGIQIGYNQRFPKDALLGLETDFGPLTLSQNKSVSAIYVDASTISFTIYQQIRTNWLYTLRPRLGYTFNKTLLFATGGLSVTDCHYKQTFTDDFDTLSDLFQSNVYQSVSKTKIAVGWNVGGGIEYLIQKNLSIFLSYLYTNFGNLTATTQIQDTFDGVYFASPINDTATLSVNLFRLGVNWHF